MIWITLIIGVALVFALQLNSSEKSLSAIDADHRPDTRLAEPDDPTSITVTLQNNSGRLIPFAGVRGQLPITQEGDFFFSSWLLPWQKISRKLSVTFPHRGRYILNDLTVSCGDFLGLKEFEKTCGSFQEIVVPPKPFHSASAQELMGGFLGDVSARRFILEDPVLTLGYREYTGSDPMKRISWSQTARHNTLMVKKNDYTVEPSVSVLLNVQTDLMDAEALESCFRATRSVCQALEKAGIRYSFSSNAVLLGYKHSNSGVSGLGQKHFASVLDVLGRACGEASLSFEQLLEKELQQPGVTGRIVITPGGEETNSRLLSRMRDGAGFLLVTGKEASTWQ